MLAGHVSPPSTLAALVHRPAAFDCRTDHLISRAMLLVQATEQFIDLGQLRDFDTSITEAKDAILEGVGCSPTSSPGWFMLFWESSISGASEGLKFGYFERSYELGPNEGWLALLRMQLAARLLDRLPQSVQNAALAELVGLVRSGFVVEVAKLYFVSSSGAQSLLDRAIESLPGPTARELRGKVQELQSVPLINALGETRRELRSSPAR